MALFGKSTFCVVTGASRGLGRETAVQLAKQWSLAGVSSDVVISGRSLEGLEGTRVLITSQSPGITVHVVTGDLGNMKSLPDLCSELLGFADASKHQQSLLVNNAGSLGDCSTPILSQTNPEAIQDYCGTNFTSMVVLTTRFLSALPSSPQYVINITSLLASVFKPGYQLYSPIKAARNAFMGVLGAEIPSVRRLNYCPGPCDTDMYKEIPDMFRVGTEHVLTAEQSITRLVALLKEDSFENGATIDYFD